MSATSLELRKAFATNRNTNGFQTLIPMATEPDVTAIGVFDLWSKNFGVTGYVPRYIDLQPFGTDADNETFNLRLFTWTKVYAQSLWIPKLLLELAVTLGNISGTAIGTGVLLADTIVVTYGESPAGPIISPANDLPASITCHLRAGRYIQFDSDINTSDTSNCFWRTMDQQ